MVASRLAKKERRSLNRLKTFPMMTLKDFTHDILLKYVIIVVFLVFMPFFYLSHCFLFPCSFVIKSRCFPAVEYEVLGKTS